MLGFKDYYILRVEKNPSGREVFKRVKGKLGYQYEGYAASGEPISLTKTQILSTLQNCLNCHSPDMHVLKVSHNYDVFILRVFAKSDIESIDIPLISCETGELFTESRVKEDRRRAFLVIKEEKVVCIDKLKRTITFRERVFTKQELKYVRSFLEYSDWLGSEDFYMKQFNKLPQGKTITQQEFYSIL